MQDITTMLESINAVDQKKILLVNPPYSYFVYKNVDRKAGTLQNPVLSLATIGATLRQHGHEVKVLDLDLYNNSWEKLEETLKQFVPHVVGITGTSPLYKEIIRIAQSVKSLAPSILVVTGGVHSSIFPEEMLNESAIDLVVIGEGDFQLVEILEGKDIDLVDGIMYKDDVIIKKTNSRELIADLDILPFPAWDLFEIHKYKGSSIAERRRPVGSLETSRGCVFNCCFCNKKMYGNSFRPKSAIRVVDEIEYMLDVGFKEIRIQDDMFSTNIKRAKAICDEIIKRKLKFFWTLFNGIRVDSVDLELFKKIKASGGYQVSFGIESGNQEILNRASKKIKVEQISEAICMANSVGLETVGFFIIGLPGETEKTIEDTIRFSKSVKLDFAKFGIAVPFPGTVLYEEWNGKGLIKTKDWSKYTQNSLLEIYNHPNLSWETLIYYYKRAFREFYFRPIYVVKRVLKSIFTGNIFSELKYVITTKWW